MLKKITEEYINSIAPNQNAIKNGWGLVKQNSFVTLHVSDDEMLIFGECMGSGVNNYLSSVDFINPENLVYRCTCPSKQFPCKHVLGLLYSYVSGKEFLAAAIPRDIMEKRDKLAQKEEKKEQEKETGKKPSVKKVNQSALLKKIRAQIEGLELLSKITNNIVQSGLGTIDSNTIELLENQVKQLGNYYLPGAQRLLRELISLFANAEDQEKGYTAAVDCLIRLYTLAEKGREYLEQRINDPEISLAAGSHLEEWLGHAWQMAELKELGFVQKDVELVQLSFNSYPDEARQEFVDNGIWLNLKTGQIQETQNYRPFKAAKNISADDSFFSVIQVKELFVYPGDDLNPRVRWENITVRALKDSDYALLRSYAATSLKGIVKSVKNQIKNPLSSKYPVALLQYARIGIIENTVVLEDQEGARIVLADILVAWEPSSMELLPLLTQESLYGQTILLRFSHEMDEGRLYAKPLSIIKEDKIIRLNY